jgi:hypothetical protein
VFLELQAQQTKNIANEHLIEEKYNPEYLYDVKEDEIRRVVDVEWATRNRPAKFVVVTQLICSISDAAGENESDDGLVSYAINDEFYCCFKAAPHPYKSEFKFVKRNG